MADGQIFTTGFLFEQNRAERRKTRLFPIAFFARNPAIAAKLRLQQNETLFLIPFTPTSGLY
ncbi:hypothetical protein FEM41_16330 [Jejubacter calystegiae]|uniref:Uncharacterized protein n=1 Tax=Jejubacter calystegiae TaxID=2579935 RepID=A0A4P8YK42_9ENTR|nr:hypothetical protein [Jejubacter calystegiae]QCT21100.1 hypothetical protein FEM41_16330 [Jejubacter calystegiae]